MANNRMITILCEGDSEYAYIQELNRYLQENECKLRFTPRRPPIGTGFFSNVAARLKEEKRKNPRSCIKILLDDDIYVRNGNVRERDNRLKFESCPYKDEFLFNTHNFEDFLMLHCDDKTLKQWLATCASTNHANVPMHSAQYEPLVKEIFPGYEKGELPIGPIDQKKLDNLFRHNEDKTVFIKSAFAAYLKGLLVKL